MRITWQNCSLSGPRTRRTQKHQGRLILAKLDAIALVLLAFTMSPEALIRVRFLTPEEGGRTGPVKGSRYGCPIMIGDKGFDCRFVLAARTRLELGKSYEIPIKFLNPELVLDGLREGVEISLWEGKTIANGEVVKILQ